MRNYYADFLQNNNSVNTLPNEVSKVSKGKESDTKHTFDTFDTTLPSINQKFYVPKNNEKQTSKSEKLHEILNRFIENGIEFDVSESDFQIIDNAQILKTSDKQFLELNQAAILCQLQQSLLLKHLFCHSPERLEDFEFEITERSAIMSDGGKESDEIYCSAVKSTTRIWFDELLRQI